MKAVRLEAARSLALREVTEPRPEPGEVLVRVEAAGICGSDRHMFKGEYPTGMPVTLGHEFCGIVTATGDDVSRIEVGQRVTVDPNIACGTCPQCRVGRVNLCENLVAIGVFRDGGFAEQVVVPERQAHVLPASVDPVHGALSEPLACCLHALDLARLQPGASVAILGGGVIGLLMVQLARLAGAGQVILVTRQESRRAVALTLGATNAIDPRARDATMELRRIVDGGVDVVIECAGVADTVTGGIKMVRRGGAMVLFGVMPEGQTVPVSPFDLLVNEIRIEPAYLNPHTHARAAAMVASGTLNFDMLVTRVIGLDEVASVVGAEPEAGEIKVIVRP